MKKKILALAIAAIMVVTALASISLAYLMDTDKDTNTFTVGNISIVQNEQQRAKTKEVTAKSSLWTYDETNLVDFAEDQQVVPAVYVNGQTKETVNVNGYDVKIRNESVQNYVDKIVSVTNTGNTNAYVRTFIAVPYNEAASNASVASGVQQGDEWLHWNSVTASDASATVDGVVKDAGWFAGKDLQNEWPAVEARNTYITEIEGITYQVSVFTNTNILTPGESSAPCLVGFYLDDDVCIEKKDEGWNYYITIEDVKYNLGDLSTMKIYCATQAVQADGFTDAFTALDAAFGAVDGENSPFPVPQN